MMVLCAAKCSFSNSLCKILFKRVNNFVTVFLNMLFINTSCYVQYRMEAPSSERQTSSIWAKSPFRKFFLFSKESILFLKTSSSLYICRQLLMLMQSHTFIITNTRGFTTFYQTIHSLEFKKNWKMFLVLTDR